MKVTSFTAENEELITYAHVIINWPMRSQNSRRRRCFCLFSRYKRKKKKLNDRESISLSAITTFKTSIANREWLFSYKLDYEINSIIPDKETDFFFPVAKKYSQTWQFWYFSKSRSNQSKQILSARWKILKEKNYVCKLAG